MKISTRSLSFALVAPLSLALVACGDSADELDTEGSAIGAIAAPDGTSWTETVTISEQDGYVLGNPDAPLKLVEYASHTCGACANFSATAKKPLVDQYVASGVVSFEQRNLIRDPIDLTIATLVRCGVKENMQPLSDQAWAALNDIFGNIQQNGDQYESAGQLPMEQRFIAIAESAGLIEFFSARGLSADQARTCLADAETIEGIAANSQAQAEELGVTATPTFFLNGRKLEVLGWQELEPVLQRAGAR